jgi:hypothetical protein
MQQPLLIPSRKPTSREADAARAAFGASEAQTHVGQMVAECDALRSAARDARELADSAEAALAAARDEAAAERAARARHEDVSLSSPGAAAGAAAEV